MRCRCRRGEGASGTKEGDENGGLLDEIHDDEMTSRDDEEAEDIYRIEMMMRGNLNQWLHYDGFSKQCQWP